MPCGLQSGKSDIWQDNNSLTQTFPRRPQREVSATEGTNVGRAYCQGGARGRAAQGAARPAWRATSSAGITGGGCAMKRTISLILVLAFATQSQARWKPE